MLIIECLDVQAYANIGMDINTICTHVFFSLYTRLSRLCGLEMGGLGKSIGLPLPANAGSSHSLASPGLTWVERGLVRQS